MGGRGVCAGGSAFVCLLALAAPVSGQCFHGTRRTTKGERMFYVNTLGALKAAMPAPPPGWRVVEETDVRGPSAILRRPREGAAVARVRRSLRARQPARAGREPATGERPR